MSFRSRSPFFRLLFILAALSSTLAEAASSLNDTMNTLLEPDARLNLVWENRGESWKARHEAIIERNRQGAVDLIFLGDSITHSWEPPGEGGPIWTAHYEPLNSVNMGFGGDRIQHLLWRLENGEVEGISPKVAVVMIGTNNSQANTVEEIAEGVGEVCRQLRERLPDTKVLLLAIFPRVSENPIAGATVALANARIAALDDGEWIHYLDIGDAFREPGGWLRKDLFPDGLHPNAEGYAIWHEAMRKSLSILLGREIPAWPLQEEG